MHKCLFFILRGNKIFAMWINFHLCGSYYAYMAGALFTIIFKFFLLVEASIHVLYFHHNTDGIIFRD